MLLYILFQLPEYNIPPTRNVDYNKNREYLGAQPLHLLHTIYMLGEKVR
jgi:hypothetical protein